MRRGEKWLILLLLCLLLLPSAAAFAASSGVWDLADLFSENEAADLLQQIVSIEGEYQIALSIVTTEDAAGKTAKLYAEDFYVENELGYGRNQDGALLLIDMDNREAWIATTGSAIRYLTDQRIEDLLDAAYEGLAVADYYQAALAFLDGAAGYFAAGIVENQYNYDAETGVVDYYTSPTVIIPFVVGGLLLGALVALIFYIGNKRKYAFLVKPKQSFYPFRQQSRLQLLRQEDIFLNKHIHKVHVPKPPPPPPTSFGGGSSGGGGRSTVSTHSSGRSFGGGGRKF